MVFWDNVFADVARDFPDIQTESMLVDAACMNLVRKPEAFDVIVASNLFGDILSDLAAAVTGSMGLAPSGNINPERRFPSMFEPVHGSAPDIMGRRVANPMAAILSAAMMLEHLGEKDAAGEVQMAVQATLARSRDLTIDLGGSASTAKVGDTIAALIGK
jgi:tartrate dehydrogenase/decarboxylase/D-malate dehydrogenase